MTALGRFEWNHHRLRVSGFQTAIIWLNQCIERVALQLLTESLVADVGSELRMTPLTDTLNRNLQCCVW